MSGRRQLIVAVAASVLGLLFVAVGVCWRYGSSSDAESGPSAPAVLAAFDGIERMFRAQGDGVSIRRISVRGMDAAAFRRELGRLPDGAVSTLWMPGAHDWLLVSTPKGVRPRLAGLMDALGETDSYYSLPELFASYVGTVTEVMPAFESRLEGDCVPQWFVTREIPKFDWLDVSDIDEDILKETMAEIRSKQALRRLALNGNVIAEAGTDKESRDKAIDCWSRALKRNPRDPMLLERLDTLHRNAKTFLGAGKVLEAMKCYETIVLVNPKDAVAINNFGVCLRRIGKTELAEKVLARARKLSRGPSDCGIITNQNEKRSVNGH